MLRWYLLALILALILCSKYAPHSAIARSAQDAFDSSVLELSGSDCSPDDEEEYLPASAAPRKGRATGAATAPSAGRQKRKRVTPFQAKIVAAAQDWRCGCGCRDPDDARGRGYQLDANFEIDHRVPTRWGGEHDETNWVAVLRSHHAIKSARESSMSARRGR